MVVLRSIYVVQASQDKKAKGKVKFRFSSLVYLENFSSPLYQNENCWIKSQSSAR
jgi:hypothetical protein